MKTSIKLELTAYLLNLINDGVIDNSNIEDWHFHAFNEDYYVGHYNASEWLKTHNIDAFEAISICQEYERTNFGEVYKIYNNSETTVNMLAYIYGEELLNEIGANNIEELTEELQSVA